MTLTDGNFTAHHMNMRQLELDIFLLDGLGYIVTEREYQAHLASATESKENQQLHGAGQVDREILETLWAPFNKISPTAHSMSQSHCQEILDDLMQNSNWKKLVGIIKMLLQKYKHANKGINDTKVPFEELTSSLEFSQVSSWEKDEKQAIE
ncbi:hypothetical protein BDR04DRAFT_1122871 [Suillus decipiens]|nr:hypothetical protein BDR04DRAFT_1122871 [Suillus decipiens]